MQILSVHAVLIYLVLLLRSATGEPDCPATSYYGAQLVKFPFRINPTQPVNCGYPGFDLRTNRTVDRQTQLIINLPGSGDFTIHEIDYRSQNMRISDPNQCLLKRLLKNPINFKGSPFSMVEPEAMFLLNCSSLVSFYSGSVVPCLSSRNYTVRLVPNLLSRPACPLIGTVTVSKTYYWFEESGIRVSWKEPDCQYCELRRGYCGFKNSRTRVIGCFGLTSSGSRAGAGSGKLLKLFFILPGLVCISSVIFVIIVKIKSRNSSRASLQIAEITIPPTINNSLGLSEFVIKKYPKIYLGESKRLPNPSDNICAICLSEYEAKETLKIIPHCNHYFHIDCIDHWLLINGRCPLCRA